MVYLLTSKEQPLANKSELLTRYVILESDAVMACEISSNLRTLTLLFTREERFSASTKHIESDFLLRLLRTIKLVETPVELKIPEH